jgi:hypothetical protein
MAIVIIDKTVEITRPAVGIGAETVLILRGSSCTESIIVRFLRNSLAPTVDARRSLIHMGQAVSPPVHGALNKRA